MQEHPSMPAQSLVVALLVAVGTSHAASFYVKQDGSAPGGYTTVQAALNAAVGAGAGQHTITIQDSQSYDEIVSPAGATSNQFFTIQAGAGQLPTLYAYSEGSAACGIAFRGLTFDSRIHAPASPTTNPAAIYFYPPTGKTPNFTEILRVQNCVFRGGSNWNTTMAAAGTAGIYVSFPAAIPPGQQVSIVSNRFAMLDYTNKGFAVFRNEDSVRWIVTSNYFTGYRGIHDNRQSNDLSRMEISYNVFDNLLDSGFYRFPKNSGNTAWFAVTNTVLHHNTFYKSGGAVPGCGAMVLPIPGTTNMDIGISARNNLFYGSAPSGNKYEGFNFYRANPTNANLAYNGFCNMKTGSTNFPGFWNNTWQSVAALNSIGGCSNNVVNNADPFVNEAAGNFHLKAGAWALTAADDGGFIGAFGLPAPRHRGMAVQFR